MARKRVVGKIKAGVVKMKGKYYKYIPEEGHIGPFNSALKASKAKSIFKKRGK